MKYPIHLTPEQASQLEFEHVSDELKVHLTRRLERWTEDTDDQNLKLYRKNRLINWSRAIAGGKIYVLQCDDMGEYMLQEHGYHDSQFELVLRNLSNVEFVEMLAKLIAKDYFTVAEINELLKRDGVTFRFEGRIPDITVDVMTVADFEEEEHESTHDNIRILVSRMDAAVDAKDPAAVLHSSASVFETLAKDVVGIPAVQNQTLGGFFGRYRHDSLLPSEILDFILDTYNSRNTTPLAGHGSTQTPTITEEQATILAEMTKAFVRAEYRLRQG